MGLLTQLKLLDRLNGSADRSGLPLLLAQDGQQPGCPAVRLMERIE
jgi:hypothetical protein